MVSKEIFYKTLCQRHGEERQRRFQEARVAVCGLGGLGSHVAVALARAGVGHLHLIDFDRVEVSNLHRQNYRMFQVGMEKTQALQEVIAEINPYCEVTTHCRKLESTNIPQLLEWDDVICEAFDVPECKAELVNTVFEHFTDKYVVASCGMSGFSSGNTIQTRRVAKRLYVCGDGQSDVALDGTLYISRVQICAAHQANTILRILAGKLEE